MLKIGSAVLQKELKMFKFWCTWMDWNNVPRIASPYFGIRNGARFKLFLFCFSPPSKEYQTSLVKEKNIVHAFENRNIFRLRIWKLNTHFRRYLWWGMVWVKKISHNSKNSLFTRFNSSSIPICRFQSINESLIIMLQLYIHVTDFKTVFRSSNIKTPPTFAAPDYIKLHILCNDK